MDNISEISTFEIIKKSSNKYNLKYKIILIGDPSVGKSCICLKQVKNLFVNEYISTNNYMDYDTEVKYKDLTIKLQLFDTSGNENFNSILEILYKYASLALIVYSIDK